MWAGLLTCVLRGWSSQLALYRLLTLGSFWHYPRLAISDQAVYKRLAQEGTKPLVALFTQLTALLRLERMCPTSPCGPPSQARDSGDPSPSLTLLSSTTLGYENQEWLVYSVRLDV